MSEMLGHNNPPEPTAFEAISVHLDDIRTEARNWCDGAQIETQQQADQVGRLIEELRKGHKALDQARKDEAKPFDDGKAEIQARYNPILKSTDTAIDACKKTLAPFLMRLEAVKQAEADAKRKAAQEAAQAAQAAARAADHANLEAREAAEELIAKAAAAEAEAKRAEGARAHAKGGDRAVGLRSYWTPQLTDLQLAVRHFWTLDPALFEPLVMDLARKEIASGKRTISGFDVIEERRAV
jgi:hypothetical protein